MTIHDFEKYNGKKITVDYFDFIKNCNMIKEITIVDKRVCVRNCQEDSKSWDEIYIPFIYFYNENGVKTPIIVDHINKIELVKNYQ